MLIERRYNRERAVEYARRWAFSRSPLFESYNGIGGDYTRDFGWYYSSPMNRAPAWTGVEFFYNFMTSNEGVGPYMSDTYPGGLELGDVIQLGNTDGDFYHTLIIVGFLPDDYLVSAHSNDVFNRPLSTYEYDRIRYLHVEGVRADYPIDCFGGFINGERI